MPVSERIAAWLSPMLDSPAAYLHRMATDPMLLVSTLLTLGVILVNGWTDAPNAIATCVSTRAIGVRRAVGMAAVCNFLGVLVMTAVNHSRTDRPVRRHGGYRDLGDCRLVFRDPDQ